MFDRIFDIANSCYLKAPDIVLSAAHCAVVDDSEMLVRTNPHSRSDPADGSEVFAVVDSVLHPNFDDTAILENDIWVMKLDGRSSQPLARINEDPRIPIENQTLSAAGWGDTEFSSPDPLPDILQITDEMKYISNGQCLEVYGDLANATADNLLDQMIPANLMCVSSPTGQGICQGDSGTSTHYLQYIAIHASFIDLPCINRRSCVYQRINLLRRHTGWNFFLLDW